MTLAFFTLSALDLLGDLDAALSPEERQGYVEWVYNCQLPEGGFRAFPGADFGPLRTDENKVWDPANVAATFFALLSLTLLGDDLQRVQRKEILQWIKALQRPDGSFGEALGEGGRTQGGSDTRFGYMAVGIRWILRGDAEGSVDGVPDIDVDSFVSYVRSIEACIGRHNWHCAIADSRRRSTGESLMATIMRPMLDLRAVPSMPLSLSTAFLYMQGRPTPNPIPFAAYPIYH